jgi:prepilin-type processing-associated H-X9-DG protein
MRSSSNRLRHRGFTVKDLAVTLTCLLLAAGMLASLTGVTRDLSKVQVCTSNLRQMYTGLTAYVEQYDCYPPHNPFPAYMAVRKVNGLITNGFDPSIGFILTHGLGLTPPATDSATGHFIWFGPAFDSLPDVCKCPDMSPALLEPNPETDTFALECFLFQYALSYMTPGTCRAATPVVREQVGSTTGVGGRNPPIPDPTTGIASMPYDNATGVTPYIWAMQHAYGAAPDENVGNSEYSCWVQAVHPAEVQSPGRIFYLADSRDYRPVPNGWPRAGMNNGWGTGYGNKMFLGARHFGYSNVMYLDGHVSRDNQTHIPQWNIDYDASTQQARATQWRAATFATQVPVANLQTQVHMMPILMVKGWEYFFDASGVKAQ